MPKTTKTARTATAKAATTKAANAPKDNLLQFRTKLTEQQTELSERIHSAVEQGRETGADPAADAVDQAVSAYQRELLFSRGNHEHDQLQLVRQALGRIEDGTFGMCVECEEKIGEKRLDALPWTPYCIECQEKLEHNREQERLQKRAS